MCCSVMSFYGVLRFGVAPSLREGFRRSVEFLVCSELHMRRTNLCSGDADCQNHRVRLKHLSVGGFDAKQTTAAAALRTPYPLPQNIIRSSSNSRGGVRVLRVGRSRDGFFEADSRHSFTTQNLPTVFLDGA